MATLYFAVRITYIKSVSLALNTAYALRSTSKEGRI